ncbi:hypothetical protein ACI0FR_02865 [Paenochrobactrum sp. BZR 201-1]
MLRIAPCTTRTIKAIGLIGLQHGTDIGQSRPALQNLLAGTFKRAPSARSFRSLADKAGFTAALAHARSSLYVSYAFILPVINFIE